MSIHDITEITYYTYDVGKYVPRFFDDAKTFVPYKHQADKRLIWNVFTEEYSEKRIKVFNIFKHYSFTQELLKIKRKYKTFEKFADEVRSSLMYYFWSKSEWEIILTSWPPYIDGEELNRLIEIKEKEEYKVFKENVSLEIAEKVDVYDQVMLNWDNFIIYLWNNRKLITKKKLDIWN